MDGWIKLYRKTLESNMYKSMNSRQRDVMISCLLLANHEGKEWKWKTEIYKCDPGQFISSLSKIAKSCSKDVKIQSVRNALSILEKNDFLTNVATKTGRLITICNWEIYQGLKPEEEQRSEQSSQQSSHHQESGVEVIPNKINNLGENRYSENTNKETNKAGNKENCIHNYSNNSDLSMETIFDETKTETKLPTPNKNIRRKKDNITNVILQKERIFGEDEIEYKFAKKFYDDILKVDQKFKEPNFQKWSLDIDRMFRLDGRSIDEIRSAYRFMVKDPFWRSNILSPKKFRERIPQLVIKMKNSEVTNGKHTKIIEELSERFDPIEAAKQRKRIENDN